ncbi:MAG: helix-turn-helix domain-containing protein [Planctomycetes bacterium]|nr:helix-turn-helix domain-containing protein [Planctomycetota bacterium]
MAETETTIKLEPLVLTCQQVGELLQVSESTVTNLHRVRQLSAVLVGKHLRWRLCDVELYVSELTPGGAEGTV